ncbi:hypothetical protein FIBSPDRAFT_428804 [Athelia psychrophila]|uniref:Uncharacterized protein n=1 Tax=Athelia psychrophila TaxID=1759441 RepID=A0A167UK32_9AGAM|nr:hypothetical protein FIBSPDRAFT_428804 [Fibularhizoctonia sp. CBS 109695]
MLLTGFVAIQLQYSSGPMVVWLLFRCRKVFKFRNFKCSGQGARSCDQVEEVRELSKWSALRSHYAM